MKLMQNVPAAAIINPKKYSLDVSSLDSLFDEVLIMMIPMSEPTIANNS